VSNKKTGSINNFRILFSRLSEGRKLLFLKLLLLMIAGGLAEIVSLGMIFPFLAILIDPQYTLSIPLISWALELFNFTVGESIYNKITLLFLLVIVVANVIRFLLISTTIKFNFIVGHELGIEIYKNALYRKYTDHLDSHSSELIGGLNKLEHLVWVILGVIQSISGLVMIVFIIITLTFINPTLTFFVLFGLASIYLIFSVISRDKLSMSSQVISKNSNKRIQSVQEGLGSIRDILLDHNQEVFINRFSKIDWEMRSAQISNNIIGPMPRFVVESVAMIFIVSFAYLSIVESGDAAYVVPMLGVLVVSLQRLIPLAQQVYFGWSQFNGNRETLHDVVSLVGRHTHKDIQETIERIDFQNYIQFNNISFRYKSSLPFVINNINFKIIKGSRIGFIGSTGSGKSTVVDLLLALISPTNGKILIDGVCLSKAHYSAWQSCIAHVPQSVYLLDGSFKENIAFGIESEKIDMKLVINAAEKAKISNFIDGCDDGYNTRIGEGGSLLSGGQVQRIGIARALYKGASILVFDEATSSLDGGIESEIINTINNLDKCITIIVITHSLSTLKNSDWVYKLDQGVIIKEGPPKSMLNEKLS